MNIPKKCDVLVIGGGPAGSMAATYLSQKGYDVVLLERQKHPRPHIGENLIPHFWKYTDLAKVSDKIAAEGFVRKAGGTVAWNGSIRQMEFKNFGYSRSGFHVERERFDHILLNHAREQGVQVFEEVSVLKVDLNGEGELQNITYRLVQDKTTAQISCQFIVDASGQSAVIARQLGIRTVDESFRFMSIWGYFKNSKYVGVDGKAHPYEDMSKVRPMTFQTAIREAGDWAWSWHIPLRENTSVGLVLPIEFMKTVIQSGQSWESYFLQKCYEIPILNQLLADAQFCQGSFSKIQDYSYRMTKVAGSGFFLIGDAAGFIDPIFSIGVILGMYSAYIAAWAIDRCFKDRNSIAYNQQLFTSQLIGRYEASRSLALPRYKVSNQESTLGKTAVQFQGSLEQELMNVVSQMSTRSDNFVELVRDNNGKDISSDKFQVLEEILF